MIRSNTELVSMKSRRERVNKDIHFQPPLGHGQPTVTLFSTPPLVVERPAPCQPGTRWQRQLAQQGGMAAGQECRLDADGAVQARAGGV